MLRWRGMSAAAWMRRGCASSKMRGGRRDMETRRGESTRMKRGRGARMEGWRRFGTIDWRRMGDSASFARIKAVEEVAEGRRIWRSRGTWASRRFAGKGPVHRRGRASFFARSRAVKKPAEERRRLRWRGGVLRHPRCRRGGGYGARMGIGPSRHTAWMIGGERLAERMCEGGIGMGDVCAGRRVEGCGMSRPDLRRRRCGTGQARIYRQRLIDVGAAIDRRIAYIRAHMIWPRIRRRPDIGRVDRHRISGAPVIGRQAGCGRKPHVLDWRP